MLLLIDNTQAQVKPKIVKAVFTSVKIGKQTWMVKNLDLATYRNGDAIPNVSNEAEWAALTTGAWCYYKNDSVTYAATYGKLYNWFAVNDPRGLAPAGWHVPSDAEWNTMETSLGNKSVTGLKMKEPGTTHWQTPNTGATNSSGFSALPGGFYISGDFGADIQVFDNVGKYAYWWSSNVKNVYYASCFSLSYNTNRIHRDNHVKMYGMSVRCIRNK